MSVFRNLHPLKEPLLDAACVDVPTFVFFEGDTTGKNEYKRLAKETCGRCPIQQQCLDVALRNREQEGIWGGKTSTERRMILRQMFSRRFRK